MPSSWGLFASLSLPDKLVAVSFVALVGVLCILQVRMANKNREIQRLRRITNSLTASATTEHLSKHGKEHTKYTQKGEGIGDNYE